MSKHVSASFACEECEEYLCVECKSLHVSQRQNKNHPIKSLSQVLLCEPCRNADKKADASSYCTDCKEPEPLCQRCADQHKVMKRSRGHNLSSDMTMYILRYKPSKKDETDELDSKKDEPCCEPCNYYNKQIVATHYCKDCKERYCNNCMRKHNSKKSLKDHNIVEMIDALNVTTLCEPCLYNNVKNEATDHCEDCDEYLCISCKKTHLSQKSTRNHKFVTAAAIIQCKNCSESGNAVKATFVCNDCKETICDSCAEDHKAMKKTKNHLLSTDMTTYVLQNRHENNVRNTSEERQIGVAIPIKPASVVGAKALAGASGKSWQCTECDPCRCDDKQVEASSYCKECDEYLCEECMAYHQTQIENINHQVNSISTEVIMCYTCKSLNKEAIAIYQCEDCKNPEPLCETCAKKHIKMKSTRGHHLSEDLSHIVKRQALITSNQTKRARNKCRTNATRKTYLNIAKIVQNTEKSTKKESNEMLGQPYSTESKSDRIALQWKSEYTLNQNEVYQIMYKETPNGKWKASSDKESCKSAKVVVDGLKSDTSYTFKVRIINDSSGDEGPFTKQSEIIKTRPSPALGILKTAELIDHGPPAVYRLPIKENVSGRNESAKTRKFFLGKVGSDFTEKTIMIVGATGSGKSTLINGMTNYIMGVTWEDPFRFTLISLETDEQQRKDDQALSQTEWVTCYTLHNGVSDRVNYSVNLIDTPGFGDTRGLQQDGKIVDQIRELFTATGEEGVTTLDAVCFILKAPDARLTLPQKYIFESILSLFGKDIKDNICTLITFADGQRPPVLSALQALDGIPLPYETYFSFNNSALYVDNAANIVNNLAPFFWDMGNESCKTFFDHVNKMEPRSLTLMSEVLTKRQTLENTVKNLQDQIQVGLSKINVLEKEVDLFTKHANAILDNKNFEYEVDEDYQEKTDLTGKGQYTTNCLTCNYTCHENCGIPNDDAKAGCIAMNNKGMCIQCPKECHWSNHHNTPYIIKWAKRKVKKKYEDMKRKYEEATQSTLTQEQVLEEMDQDIARQENAIQVMLEVIAKLNNRLKEIALRPDPLSTVEYIDLMIESEKREMKSGFATRIDALEKCKQRSTYGADVQIFKDRVSKSRMTMVPGDVADAILKDENKSIFGSIKTFFTFQKKK